VKSTTPLSPPDVVWLDHARPKVAREVKVGQESATSFIWAMTGVTAFALSLRAAIAGPPPANHQPGLALL